ncbi:sulfotransferase [Alcanivorax sp. JB21]|uniref:sulfotransferase family protein n=1 Tax=Alcanivorax limicola TaxID=2874102 RepID=UPI001CBE4001|nr:sulfotransferase [Alcanivorax limicola]MBZ2190308.1 sulfotransferase [Alcanivorax limicola]
MKVKYQVDHHMKLGKYAQLMKKVAARKLEDLLSRNIPHGDSSPPIVLVVGCGHSGTTLISARLGNHPDVLAIGRETRLLFPNRNSLSAASRIIDEWFYFCEHLNKKVVLEKTPKHIHLVERMASLTDNFKVVAMVRNPLDNIASLYKRFADIEYSVERWLYDNEALLKIQPDRRVKVVRYENLTSDPMRVFSEVSDFIGIVRSESVLAAGNTVYDVSALQGNMKIRQGQVRAEIRVNNGKWRDSLTDDCAEKILERTRPLAEKFGYDGGLWLA